MKVEEISHSYPHCWRCKKPVIFRATEQWFVSMQKNKLRGKALDCINKTKWVPPWGGNRITGMVENRPDWCLSRQRSWGIPIVSFYCNKCGELLLDSRIINHVADLFEKEGSDVWFSHEIEQLMPPNINIKCSECGAQDFKKETDILDVWFDSGVSHAAVLEKVRGLGSPCDLYLEGSDQHRGWFQSSLLTSVVTRGRAPYRSVLTHGFVVDGKGKKMAKSKGNVIRPEEIINQYGADILRLWVASENYQEDMRISRDILKRISEAYRKIRNTCRFMHGNLYDFDPQTNSAPYSELQEIDRWALYRLNLLIKKVAAAYETYEFHTIYHSITNFCITDMSAVYLDILKDRLYCSAASDSLRKTAQSTISYILTSLLKLLAPILTFTSEEAWQLMPGHKDQSIHLESFPTFDDELDNKKLADRWAVLLKTRDMVLKFLEDARENKQIGNSLEAAVRLVVPQKLYDFMLPYSEHLADLYIVSNVQLDTKDQSNDSSLENLIEDVEITISRVEGEKCQRCWKYYAAKDSPINGDICDRCAKALKMP